MVEKELLAITLKLIELLETTTKLSMKGSIMVSITDLKLVDATEHSLVELYFLKEQKQIDHLH